MNLLLEQVVFFTCYIALFGYHFALSSMRRAFFLSCDFFMFSKHAFFCASWVFVCDYKWELTSRMLISCTFFLWQYIIMCVNWRIKFGYWMEKESAHFFSFLVSLYLLYSTFFNIIVYVHRCFNNFYILLSSRVVGIKIFQ